MRFEPDFARVYGVELYNLTADREESVNIAVTRAGDPAV